MRKFCIALLLVASIPFFSSQAEARNLSRRLGVGYTSQIAVTPESTIPAISTKYYFSPNFGTSLGFGFDTRSSANTFAVGLKAYYVLFHEDNMNFYTGAGFGVISRAGSKTQFSMFLGSEFFFSGLPSLGFCFEAGIRADNTSGSYAIRTTGDSILTAGAHFYF